MRVLIAPDKFKHALDARSAAEAMARGVRSVVPDAQIDLCPMADGGEGTARVLANANWEGEAPAQPFATAGHGSSSATGSPSAAAARHAGAPPTRDRRPFSPRSENVHDPLGRSITANWWRHNTFTLAIVELADASGLHLLHLEEQDPLRTSTYGTGELITKAIRAGAGRILLAVGGSATVDGGAGILQALGWEFIDSSGVPIPPGIGGGDLLRIAQIRRPAGELRARLTVLADVDNPLLGPRGAARLFAPQKGADAAAVEQLERGLEHWAGLLASQKLDAAPDFRSTQFLGAAGGVPAGLLMGLNADIWRGFDFVAGAVRLAKRIAESDLCFTGEGRLDRQTLSGKVVGGVAKLAADAGVPCIALVGRVETSPGTDATLLVKELGLQRIVPISAESTPLETALGSTAPNLEAAAADCIRNARALI